MLPEISRRCRSCGAAVRAGARFCPQCGKVMGEEPDAASTAPETPEVDSTREVESPPEAAPTVREAEPAHDWTPPTKEFAAFTQSRAAPEPPAVRAEDEPSRAADEEPRHVVDDAPAPAARPYAVGEPPRAEEYVVVEPLRAEDDGAAEGVNEGAEVGADGAGAEAGGGDARGRVARVRDGTRARVERMREEAIVVLEETPDDSGLRFVVAAAALFVVFVVLLFLSTTVLR